MRPYERPSCVRFTLILWAGALAVLGLAGHAAANEDTTPPRHASGPFVNFETPPIRPIALTTDGSKILAVNTPDGRLSVFDVATHQLLQEIPVGLDPVTVIQHAPSGLVWVANHLSDNVSIVDLNLGYVIRSVEIGDEPADIVFNASGTHAFVTLSEERRVVSIDTATYQTSYVEIPGADPRTLAIDGDSLFVCVHLSGNNTTILKALDPNSPQIPPPPYANPDLPQAPQVGTIVADTDSRAQVDTPDNDVITVDVSDPTAMTIGTSFHDVGTLLESVARNPSNGLLFVVGTNALNLVQFEPSLKGHFVDHIVTVIDPSMSSVTMTNVHASLATFDDVSEPNAEAQAISLAGLDDVVFNPAGTRAYVAALGADRVGVLDGTTAEVLDRVSVDAGPRGLAVNSDGTRLYVYNRFAMTIQVLDIEDDANAVIATFPIGYDPEPADVTDGRSFLYSAKQSFNWGSSCHNCHPDGNADGLAWDLGDPGGDLQPPPELFTKEFHPMKGPMVTQSLRGLKGHVPLHRRGDRTALTSFNLAFSSLLGGSTLNGSNMTKFRKTMESIEFPPNPNRNRNNSFKDALAPAGRTIFNNGTGNPLGVTFCAGCHMSQFDGDFQSSPDFRDQLIDRQALIGEPQLMEIAQLRGMNERDISAYTGFGFRHDGEDMSLSAFLATPPFALSANERTQVAAYLRAFPTNVWPIVGQQITLDQSNATDAPNTAAIALMVSQSALATPNCDLVVKGSYLGDARGFYLANPASQMFDSDRDDDPQVDLSTLKTACESGDAVLTFTAVPPGSGRRIGVDRDGDLYGDRTEIENGTDPADPISHPCAVLGDTNCDDAVNGLDVEGFINLALGLDLDIRHIRRADYDHDGDIDAADSAAFVQSCLGQ